MIRSSSYRKLLEKRLQRAIRKMGFGERDGIVARWYSWAKSQQWR